MANGIQSPVLVDTQTGRAWQGIYLSDQGGRLVWAYTKRLDTAADVRKFVADSRVKDHQEVVGIKK